jgi:predicted XRE-type DNA-binding protein
VLHAFQKKSKSGIKTPKPDVDLVEQRLKVVLERHRDGRSDDMTRKIKDRGTRNVLADLEFLDAEELTAKTILAKKINDIVESRRLTQFDTAKLLGMPQPKVSAIRNYRLRGISLERLMLALTALGQHVEITVSPSNRRAPARIDVAA